MSRYFTRPRGRLRAFDEWHDNDAPLLPSIEVPEHETIDTGLLDVAGEKIWRAPNPLGFGRDDEW